MKSKVLAALSIIYIYTIATAPAVWALSDATSFSPEKVRVQAQSIGVPVGTVIVWTKNAVPDGWLECNGQAVNKVLYPELAALMSNVPNYQGMFLRGAGSQIINHGSYGSVNHGTILGQMQGDTIRDTLEGTFEIRDDWGSLGAFTNTTGVFSAYGGSGRGRIRATEGYVAEKTLKFSMKNAIPTANEIRPVNVGVKYIIKAE